MSESVTQYNLAPKYVLAPKESVIVPVNDLTVTLGWNAPVDLDLSGFGRLKDGTEFSLHHIGGGVQIYPTTEDVEDVLISLSHDAGVGAQDAQNVNYKTEEMKIVRLPDNLEIFYIFALNFDDAKKGNSASFVNYDGLIKVTDVSGDHDFGVELDSADPGYFFEIATLEGNGALTRTGKVYGMDASFFEHIPDAKSMLL